MRTLVTTALILGLLVAPLAAEEAPKSTESASTTVTVERGPLGGHVEVKGMLVPRDYERVKIDFEAYGGKLEIIEAAPEGRVVEGQTLIRFDDKDYKEQRHNAARGLEIRRIGVEKAGRLWDLSRRTSDIRRDEVMRALIHAKEALGRFIAVERKLKEEDAAYSKSGRQIGIQNMREELAQLETMYTEDDLTEETEEIVLKRNRRNMERMLESYERWAKRHDYGVELGLKREHESLELALRKAKAGFERLEATEELDRKKAELDYENAREGLRKAEENFAKLEGDADKFVLKAPMGGLAVRGSFSARGWQGLGNDEAYGPGETMKTGQTPYTIVDEAVMRIHTSVKEADLATIQVGAPASFTTALTGDDELEAEVGKVARYGSGGTYQVILRVKGEHPKLRAGLGCSANIERRGGKDVLHVPAGCLRKEKDGHVVFTPDGKAHEVKVGKRNNGRVEITDGVEAGQVLLASPPAKPDPKKKDAAKDGDEEKASK